MLNPYLNVHSTTQEQNLVQELTDELIQMFGVDVQYSMRDMVTRDNILGESASSEFNNWIKIEMMPEDLNGFNGDGDLFGKFGLEVNDSCTLVVSVQRFREEAVQLKLERPREGDIVLDPITKSLWEVKRVKQDREYFKLGRNYVYRLECELFIFGHEQLHDSPEAQAMFDAKSHPLSEFEGMGETIGLGVPVDESFELNLEAPTPQKINLPSGGNIHDPFGEGF